MAINPGTTMVRRLVSPKEIDPSATIATSSVIETAVLLSKTAIRFIESGGTKNMIDLGTSLQTMNSFTDKMETDTNLSQMNGLLTGIGTRLKTRDHAPWNAGTTTLGAQDRGFARRHMPNTLTIRDIRITHQED